MGLEEADREEEGLRGASRSASIAIGATSSAWWLSTSITSS